MKENCKIVQDLLPNYIENLTNEETNNYIEKHLNNCEECSKIYSSMKENIKLEPIEMKKEVKYMKKFNKQIKVLKFLIIAILIIFIFVIGRKTIIMTSLYNNANENLERYLNNYHITSTIYSKNEIIYTETYCNGIARISFTKKGTIGEVEEEITCYERDNEKINLLKSGNLKIKSDNISDIHVTPQVYTSTFFSNLQNSFIIDIESVTLNSKKCYVVKSKSYDRFIEKETGLLLKEIDYANATVTDYSYEFGNVEDDDIIRPDTTGYIEQ